MKKYFIVALGFCLNYGITNAQFTGTFPGGPSQQFCAGNVTIGNHLTFNSNAGVINWGGGGTGDLYFRRLTTQGTYSSGFNNLMIIKGSGNVGIGTVAPVTLLHVKGDVTFGSDVNKRKWRFITQNWIDGGKMFLVPDMQDGSVNADYSKALTIDPLKGNFTFGQDGGMISTTMGSAYTTSLFGTSYLGFNAHRSPANGDWTSATDGGNSGGAIIFGKVEGGLVISPTTNTGATTNQYNDAAVWNRRTLQVKWNATAGLGQVCIGPLSITSGTHTDYRLSVDGKLVAKEIYVTNTGWADYVFDDNYQLMDLDSLKEYININNHLPNVPTTEEVMENGNNTGETDRILLEKVEELTLYILQLEKRIKGLESNTIEVVKE